MKHNYLNNKDILKEIHKSKNTYCYYTSPEVADYDMILPDVSKINKKNILQARKDRAVRLTKLAHEAALLETGVKRKLDEFEVKLKDVADTDVVFRVMTWDHIPVDDAKSRKAAIKALEEEGGRCSSSSIRIRCAGPSMSSNWPLFTAQRNTAAITPTKASESGTSR